ncbi:hypothetical protein COT72_00965 [archaeon CG10_big_fil_rev_8_21_14_0_10_43_11]|nr:MAG: hypothetical protein COT72_00965 [archaeon CG10_big_fil_rev_8_21_14_0_10_43_11]
MKVLQLHCTHFEYVATKKTPVAIGDGGSGSFDNVLVCFTTYEKYDENRHEEIIKTYKQKLLTDFERMKFKTVLIHPYAHLSTNLGSQKKAIQFLEELKHALRATPYTVFQSPFGWYKAWKTEVKGHPLADAFREY